MISSFVNELFYLILLTTIGYGCCRWHQLFCDVDKVSQVIIESWYLVDTFLIIKSCLDYWL